VLLLLLLLVLLMVVEVVVLLLLLLVVVVVLLLLVVVSGGTSTSWHLKHGLWFSRPVLAAVVIRPEPLRRRVLGEPGGGRRGWCSLRTDRRDAAARADTCGAARLVKPMLHTRRQLFQHGRRGNVRQLHGRRW